MEKMIGGEIRFLPASLCKRRVIEMEKPGVWPPAGNANETHWLVGFFFFFLGNF